MISHSHSNCLADQLTNSVQSSPSWKSNSSSACQEVSWLYATRRFITEFTTALHLSLPHPTVSSSHLSPGLPSVRFPSDFTTKNLLSLLPHTCHMSSPSRLPWFDHPNNVWWGVQITRLLITPLYPPSCYLLPLGPNHPPQHPVLEHPRPMFFP